MNTTYGASSKLHEKIYKAARIAAARPNRFVNTAGHSYPGLDGADAFDSATEAWTFFTAYGGR